MALSFPSWTGAQFFVTLSLNLLWVMTLVLVVGLAIVFNSMLIFALGGLWLLISHILITNEELGTDKWENETWEGRDDG